MDVNINCNWDSFTSVPRLATFPLVPFPWLNLYANSYASLPASRRHVRRCINNLNLTSTRASWNLFFPFFPNPFLNIAILSQVAMCANIGFLHHLGFCLYIVDQMFSSPPTTIRTRWFETTYPSLSLIMKFIIHWFVFHPFLGTFTSIKHSFRSVDEKTAYCCIVCPLVSSQVNVLSTVRERGTSEAYLSPIIVRPRVGSLLPSFRASSGSIYVPAIGMSANNKSRKNWHVLFVLSYNLC